MVQADDFLLTQLIPLFEPSAIATALTTLQRKGEEEISSNDVSSLYATSTSNSASRSARSQFMINALVALRNRVSHSKKSLIKEWCQRAASRQAVELHLKHDEEKKERESTLNYYKRVYAAVDELATTAIDDSEELVDNQDQDFLCNEVIEVPCLLLLCAFSVTYLPGILNPETRNEIFSQVVKIAQKDGAMIVRDDITLDEVIEFGLDVSGTPRDRWLAPAQDSAPFSLAFCGLKTMTLLWSLQQEQNNNNDFTSSSSSSLVRSMNSSIFADPHLLLWSLYSSQTCPDAVVLESAEEAKIILQQGDQQSQCDELFLSNTISTTGVIILLVADFKNWSFNSLMETCEILNSKIQTKLSYSIWIDSHECADLFDSVVKLGSFSVLQWEGDYYHSINDSSQQQKQEGKIAAWISACLTNPAFPVPLTDAHLRSNVISAAVTSYYALNEAASSICSDDMVKMICHKFCSNGCCPFGLLSYVTHRLQDIVPSYSQAQIAAASTVIISPQERRLASMRAAAPPLPPGMSMSPDVLFVFRFAETLPIDFFAAFWVSLLNRTLSSLNTLNNDWKIDPSLVKMNSKWNVLFPAATYNNSNLNSIGNSLSSSNSMCKAFSFVLTSWCEEHLLLLSKTENNYYNNATSSSCSSNTSNSVEEAVGRLKSVADVIDRHRSVEVRAFQQTVSASKWELRMLIDSYQLSRFSSSSSSASSSVSPSDEAASISGLLKIASESLSSRSELFNAWRVTGSFAKRNTRAAIIVLQQVGNQFEKEASSVASRLKEGRSNSSGEIQPMIILRMRPELERLASYYDSTLNTAVKALGVKGKNLLYMSEKLQSNMTLIRSVL